MKKYSFLPILALVLGFAASAFTSKAYDNLWRFTGSSETEVKMPGSYDQNVGSADCDFGDLPCIINPPHVQGNTAQEDLEDYLASKTAQQIVDEAVETRE